MSTKTDIGATRWNRTSVHDVATTLDRLEAAVAEFGGIRHVARLNQADVARDGGADVGPSEVVIIENPALVAQLAEVDLELLIDLPIRVLAWQDGSGRTRVRTAPPSQVAAESDHPSAQQVRRSIDRILGGWLDYAVTDAPTVDLGNLHGAREGAKIRDDHRAHVDMSPRALAARFHPNFSDGLFEKNGDLASAHVEADSNGVTVRGRAAFVERLRRYETPFPGLQLRDRIIIADGRSAAVMYVLQGTHGGPYAGHDATGHRIEAFSGEIFDFDDHGLLTRLLTVTHLDHVKAQVHGQREVDAHQTISLLPTAAVSSQDLATMMTAARSLYGRRDPDGGWPARTLIDDRTAVLLDGSPEFGAAPWQARLTTWHQAFPDLSLTVERLLQEGNRVAVAVLARGTHLGPYETGTGTPVAPTGRTVEFRTIDFLEFAGPHRLTEVVSIFNADDIHEQIRRPGGDT